MALVSSQQEYMAVADRVLARRALEAFARRREVDRDPAKILEELPALTDRAIAAGLSAEAVSALAEGRRAGSRGATSDLGDKAGRQQSVQPVARAP